MAYVFGVDLGATAIKLACFGQDSTLIDKWQIPTCTQDRGNQIIPGIAEALLCYLSQKNIPRTQVLGIGIGVPGPVLPDGTVNRCVNLGWDVLNIADSLCVLTGFPVKAGNDASLAALGESWKRGCDNLVLMTLGTGIGGGIVVNGKMLSGTGGAAGEFGHVVLESADGALCTCGNRGCAEQYCSATAVVRLAKQHLMQCHTPSILRQTADFDCKAVFDAAAAGDLPAQQVLETVYDKLAQLAALVCNTVDPELLVLGGGMSLAGAPLLDGVRRYLNKYLFHACHAEVALSALGNDAGIYGCCRLLLQSIS